MVRPKSRQRLALAARNFLDGRGGAAGHAGVADYGDDGPGKGGWSGPGAPPQPLGLCGPKRVDRHWGALAEFRGLGGPTGIGGGARGGVPSSLGRLRERRGRGR